MPSLRVLLTGGEVVERGCRYVDNAEQGGLNRIFGGGLLLFLKKRYEDRERMSATCR